MDERFLRFYERELQYIRELGAEFADEFPKVAGRLGLERFECADPYVERLLEGFAFLAARVQLKLDAEFPRFTQHLLHILYPHYLNPTPSMAVLEFSPKPKEGSLAAGFQIPRGTPLRSLTTSTGEETACEFRTGHPVTLWPVTVEEAEYISSPASLALRKLSFPAETKSGLRLLLRTTSDLPFESLSMDSLVLYLRGTGSLAMDIYEQIVGHTLAMVARDGDGDGDCAWQESVGPQQVRRLGFDPDQTLLPGHARSFEQYRLLQEYFAFPERFMFVELGGLAPAVRRCGGRAMELFVLFGRSNAELQDRLDAGNFSLSAAPAINLFPMRTDRIHIDQGQEEFHVVPDRTRPLDFEVFSLEEVKGYSAGDEHGKEFLPFYAWPRHPETDAGQTYFALRREPRRPSSNLRLRPPRSSYRGSEVFLSLVDLDHAPFAADLRQLGIKALCTNRDLPLQMPLGVGDSDFTWGVAAPLQGVRCIAGPTPPRAAWTDGDPSWRLVNHLSLNYLSLANAPDGGGAEALRTLLSLYAHLGPERQGRQIEGVHSVASRSVVRRIPVHGPIAFGRGLEVTVTLDEAPFAGSGVFLLSAVLAEFFARYASINSFTETVVRTLQRGEIFRWEPRVGLRPIL